MVARGAASDICVVLVIAAKRWLRITESNVQVLGGGEVAGAIESGNSSPRVVRQNLGFLCRGQEQQPPSTLDRRLPALVPCTGTDYTIRTVVVPGAVRGAFIKKTKNVNYELSPGAGRFGAAFSLFLVQACRVSCASPGVYADHPGVVPYMLVHFCSRGSR